MTLLFETQIECTNFSNTDTRENVCGAMIMTELLQEFIQFT